MNWDFKNAKELLDLCQEHNMPISEVMIKREMQLGEVSRESIRDRVDKCLRIMNVAVDKAISDPVKSMGGLLGGEANKMRHLDESKRICGSTIYGAIMSALAVAETNASMGVIVAAPTAGSAGVLPAVILSLYENEDISMDTLRRGLVNASAIGYIITRNGSVSGAEAGCQAEVGSACAMAASALVEMMGGTPEQCCNAASVALSNLLGLVCDPVRGLVEVPCQTRNAIGAVGAYTAAQLALADIGINIPLDEMVQITFDVGRALPESLRETAKGGCAIAPTICAMCSKEAALDKARKFM
ncbi:MAG: L-serine ammonia-lyase, iron-sulfur-dependent, subunit alpha [Mogibacterium sp.]|nr:L-serine ammonia-lyase, iron-sulfur-dependent, subunit alpha [Mogibacterium sp.]MBR2541193.1 L-serine ammonia-lyase, iron-sulfur-dependent, subunit alpha [Mogibacterium sp.]